ncbi:MAG: helix-turn-helix transcriptional regulator [Gemmatimonadaceae bacterium]
MEPNELERQIAGLSVLDEPLRRSLYFHVVHTHGEVSRDEAAVAVGTSRTLAGFHLDRLAEEGLLETRFQRLSGRTGPGAGRPAKLYRQSGRELAVSLPARRYELAARILASAIDRSGTLEVRGALESIARGEGERIGANAKARAGSRPGKRRLLAGAVATLSAEGYEPESLRGEIRLRNCPFHALVDDHKELTCGMNLALFEGVVSQLGVDGVEPVLDPQPGMCCVALKITGK